MAASPRLVPPAVGPRLPGLLAGSALFILAVLSWPGLLGRFVSLDWELGDLRPWATVTSVAAGTAGAITLWRRRGIDAFWRRVFPTPRQAVFAAGSAFLALVFGCGLAEVGLRLFHYPFRTGWTPMEYRISRFDSDLGWTYLPNIDTIQQFGAAGRVVPIRFDEIGSRVPEPGFRRDPAAPTVILVGCSYTFGHGVPYEESFAGRLAADPTFGFQVVNLGVQGYGTDQALLLLQRHFDRFNTKAVVYTFLLDHVQRNDNSDRRFLFPKARFPGTKPRYALDPGGALRLVARPARYEDLPDCHLCQTLGLFWTKWGPSPSVDLTRALVKEMKRYVESKGATFVLVLWTNVHRLPSSQVAGALFPGIELNVVDTGSTAPPEWDSWRIPGEVHPDARAHAFVARRIAEEFHALHLAPAASDSAPAGGRVSGDDAHASGPNRAAGAGGRGGESP